MTTFSSVARGILQNESQIKSLPYSTNHCPHPQQLPFQQGVKSKMSTRPTNLSTTWLRAPSPSSIASISQALTAFLQDGLLSIPQTHHSHRLPPLSEALHFLVPLPQEFSAGESSYSRKSMTTREVDSLVRRGMGPGLLLQTVPPAPQQWRSLRAVTHCSAFCHFCLLFGGKLGLKL